MESRFVTVNGVRLNYGAGPEHGPQLVFLPGFPDAWTDDTPILSALADDYTVFAPSMRGMGESGHAPPYSIAAWVADVGAFVRAVAQPPVLGVGHSAGSWFGLSAAGDDPALFRAFVSLDQPLDPALHVRFHEPRRVVYGGFARAMRAASGRDDLADRLAAVPTSKGPLLGEVESHQELLADADFFLATDPEIFAAWEHDALATWLLVPELQSWPGSYRGPVLFVDGDPDAGSMVSADAQRYNLERYPWAERVQIAGADHMLGMNENPGRVAAEIRRFFKELDR